jgi:hypothetical protein
VLDEQRGQLAAVLGAHAEHGAAANVAVRELTGGVGQHRGPQAERCDAADLVGLE